MAVAISFTDQISNLIVGVMLGPAGGKVCLRYPAQRIVLKRGGAQSGIGDLRKPVLGIVGVLHDAMTGLLRIGHRDQTIGIVVGVSRNVAVSVRDAGSPAAIIVAELGRGIV